MGLVRNLDLWIPSLFWINCMVGIHPSPVPLSCLGHLCVFQVQAYAPVLSFRNFIFFPLSHSDLQSTWNWFLCIVWIRDQDSDFSIRMANWPSTIYWKSHSFCVALLWHLFYKLGVLTCVDLFLSSQCCFTGLFIFLLYQSTLPYFLWLYNNSWSPVVKIIWLCSSLW